MSHSQVSIKYLENIKAVSSNTKPGIRHCDEDSRQKLMLSVQQCTLCETFLS